MNNLVVLSFLAFFLSFSVATLNDWNTPCFDGECSYHSEAGSLKVWGNSSAISDLTSVAGWSILNCDTDKLDQDIRLVCHDPEGCTHLSKVATVGTLVRLPEDCGASAFAHVAKVWTHNNQAIPSRVSNLIRMRSLKRGVIPKIPVVRGMTLSTDFTQVDQSKLGAVKIAIQTSTIPEANAAAAASMNFATASRRRGVASGHTLFARTFTGFDKNISTNLPPINIDKSFPIVDASISCSIPTGDGQSINFDASIKADADTKADMTISLGLAASGTIIPPKLDYAGVYAGLNGELEASLTMTGDAKGTADIGTLTLYETALGGLDFPGILTLGPTFKVLAKAAADLDVGVDLKLDMKYTMNNANLFFPPDSSHSSTGDFQNNGNPLTLSVSPSITSSGTLSADLIPRLDLGLSALGGIASATVYLDLDAGADLTLSLTASDDGSSITVNTTRRSTELQARTGSFNGCVDLNADVAIVAGANGDFFGLFNKAAQATLFEKKFDVFEKCFGNAATSTRRRDVPDLARRTNYGLEPRADLTCPTSSTVFDSLVSVITGQ